MGEHSFYKVKISEMFSTCENKVETMKRRPCLFATDFQLFTIIMTKKSQHDELQKYLDFPFWRWNETFRENKFHDNFVIEYWNLRKL